jgi:hypothetical protein
MSAQAMPAPFVPSAVPSTPPQAVMPAPAIPPKKEIPATQNKVVGAKITLSYLGEDGKTYEAVTSVNMDEFKVQSYALNVIEEHEKKRDPETKGIIGFEDTGKRTLSFKMIYHVR